MKICNNCGQKFNDEMNFCPKCGVQLSVEPKEYFCPSCGKSLGETYESFCPYCGKSFGGTNHHNENKESNSGVIETEKKGFFKPVIVIFVAILCFGMLGGRLFGGNNNPSNDKQSSLVATQSKVASNKASVKDVSQKKSSERFYPMIQRYSKNLCSYDVLGKKIWLPLFPKILNDTPPNNVNSGIAFLADVNNSLSKDKIERLNHFDVMVAFEKHPDLLKVKPNDEENALERVFDNYWKSMEKTAKTATKHELLIKEFMETIDGHKYLKVRFTSGVPNKPNLDTMHFVSFYIYDDTLFIIALDTMLRAINNHDELFETIFLTFNANLTNGNDDNGKENPNDPIPWLKK